MKRNGEMHLKKLDLANTTLFPFSWISILVIAVKLASPACYTSDFKMVVVLGN